MAANPLPDVRTVLEGVWPPASVREAAELLEKWLGDTLMQADLVPLLDDLVGEVAVSPAPLMVLQNWDRFLGAVFSRSAHVRLVRDNAVVRRLLIRLFSTSQFLTDVIIRNPEYLDWVLGEAKLDAEKEEDRYESGLQVQVKALRSPDARRRGLCRFRRRELLRVGLRDLLGLGTTAEHCREISRLAAVCCRLALADCTRDFEARYGKPRVVRGETEVETESELLVVAMGKFGAEELNFSSDIDLVFFYEDEGMTGGVTDSTGHVSRKITLQEYYSGLAAAVCQYLAEPTTEGILYRVDTRLRPDGASGAMARSLPALASYLSDLARSWERVSYLKARVIVGPPELEERFENLRQGFVFREEEPATLLGEIARLKQRIDHNAELALGGMLDIKRGRGGIREIEFFVAAFQLLYGSRYPELRVRGTLSALDILVLHEVLSPGEADSLRSTYWFFRRTEHLLQMMEDQQRHTLPADAESRELLARRVGFDTLEDFDRQISESTRFVHETFESLFYHNGEKQQDHQRLTEALLANEAPRGELAYRLEALGLNNVEGLEALRALLLGTEESATSFRAQQTFESLEEPLLQALAETPEPLLALRQLLGLLRSYHSVALLYQLFLENPRMLFLLVRTLGFGNMPGRLLIAHPSWLDELLETGLFPDAESYGKRVAERTRLDRNNRTVETLLRDVRRSKEHECLLAVMAGISGILEDRQSAVAMSGIAIHSIRQLAEILRRDMKLPESGWCLVGMGGLGSCSVHYHGDLDVALFHDPQQIDAESFSRFGGQIIQQCTAVTPQGVLWKVDARLRPDGRNAPLAVSLERARRYYDSEADIWELQSATRMRLVAGDAHFADSVLQVVRNRLCQPHDPAMLREAIAGMRQKLDGAFRMPASATYDLKRSPGGIVDIEFLVQFGQLACAHRHPEVLDPDPYGALDKLREVGWITDEEQALLTARLADLHCVQRAHRMLAETTKDFLPGDKRKRAAIESAIRGRVSLEALEKQAPAIRKLFQEVVESDRAVD